MQRRLSFLIHSSLDFGKVPLSLHSVMAEWDDFVTDPDIEDEMDLFPIGGADGPPLVIGETHVDSPVRDISAVDLETPALYPLGRIASPEPDCPSDSDSSAPREDDVAFGGYADHLTHKPTFYQLPGDPPVQKLSGVEMESPAPPPLPQVHSRTCAAASEPSSDAARAALVPGDSGTVMNGFRSVINANPTTAAQISLRELFICTGPITRTERRKPEEMEKAFEAHREPILYAMRMYPAILHRVCEILINGSRRQYDIDHNRLHAYRYLCNAARQMGK
jgi:hypothetical protein